MCRDICIATDYFIDNGILCSKYILRLPIKKINLGSTVVVMCGY